MDKLTLHGLSQFYIKLEENQKTRKLTDLMDILGVFFLPVPRSSSLHLPPPLLPLFFIPPPSALSAGPACRRTSCLARVVFCLSLKCRPRLTHFFRTSRCPGIQNENSAGNSRVPLLQLSDS